MEQKVLWIMRGLKSPRHLLQIHVQFLACGLSASSHLLPALVSAASSVSLSSSRQAAAVAIVRAASASASTVAHNNLVEHHAGRGASASGGRDCTAVNAFVAYIDMRVAGVSAIRFNFAVLLRACKSLRRQLLCRCAHEEIVRCGFDSDVVVQNALLNVYYMCGDPGDICVACQAFDEMADGDMVPWNSIVGMYMSYRDAIEDMELFEAIWRGTLSPGTRSCRCIHEGGGHGATRAVFDRMLIRDVVSWNLIVSRCAVSGNVESAWSLFDLMDWKDVVLWTTMVSAYAKIGDLDSSRVMFVQMPDKNLVSWNAMITLS